MTTLARRRPHGLYPRSAPLQPISGRKRRVLPEYLDQAEVEALIRLAPNPQAALLLLTLWRAALRISEALSLEVADIFLEGDRPARRERHHQPLGHLSLCLQPRQKATAKSSFAKGRTDSS